MLRASAEAYLERLEQLEGVSRKRVYFSLNYLMMGHGLLDSIWLNLDGNYLTAKARFKEVIPAIETPLSFSPPRDPLSPYRPI